MKAIVEPDGHVAGVFPETFPAHRKYKWVDVPADVEVRIGWFYRGGIFAPPPPGTGGRGGIANFLVDPTMPTEGGGVGGNGSGGEINIRGRDGSQRFVAARLPLVTGLQLTVQDLHALGAVVAQWAIAEAEIKFHVRRLAGLCGEDESLPREFGRVHERWKDLLKKVCGSSASHLEIGRALAGAAKILKEDRDAACHWPASRSGFDDDVDARFVRTGAEGAPFKTFATAELLSLSERIFELGEDVHTFARTIMPDLFPQQVTYVGPRPATRMIDSARFFSIENPPRPQRFG